MAETVENHVYNVASYIKFKKNCKNLQKSGKSLQKHCFLKVFGENTHYACRLDPLTKLLIMPAQAQI